MMSLWVFQEGATPDEAVKIAVNESSDVADVLEAAAAKFVWAGNSQLLASQLVLVQGGDPMSNRAKVSDISQEDVICEIRSKPGVLDDMRRGNAVFTKSSTYSTPAHSAESPSPRNAKSRPHLAHIPAYPSHHSSGPSTPATPATSGGGRKRKKRDRRASLFSNQNRASRDAMEDAAVAQGGMRRAAQVSPYSRYAPKQPFLRDDAAVRRSTSAQHAPPQEPVVLRGKAAASTKAIARSLSTATVTEQVTEALEYMFGPDEYAAKDEERRLRTRSPGTAHHRSSSNPGRRECVHFSKTSQSPTSRSGSRRGRSSSVLSSSRSPPYSPASGGTAHLFNSTSAPNESADTTDASPAALPTSRDPNQGQGRPVTSSTNSTAAAAKPPLPFPLDHLPDDDDESALSGSGKVFAQLGLTHTSYTFGQTPPGRTHGETPLDRTYGSAGFSNFLTSHSSAEGVVAGERLRTTTYGASPFHLPEACPTQEPSKARRDGSYDAGAKRRRDEMRRWQREEEAVRRAKHESVVADQRRKEILDEITQEYAAAETRRARSGSAGSLSYDSSSLPPAPPEAQGGSPVKLHKPAAVRSPPVAPVASPPPAHAPPAHYVAAHHHHHVKESKAPRSKSPGTRAAPRSPSRRSTSHTHPSPMSHHAHHVLSPTKKSTSHTHPSPLSPPKSNQARPRALSGMSRSTTGSPQVLSPVTHPRSSSPPVRTKSPRRAGLAKAGKKKAESAAAAAKSPPTPPAATPASATTPQKKAKGGQSPSARTTDSPPPPPPVVQNVRSDGAFKMFGVDSDSESESHDVAPKRQTRAAPPPRVGESEEKDEQEELSYYPKRGDTGPSEPLRQPLSPKRSSSAALSPRARSASPSWGKPPTTPSSSRASPSKRPPSPSSQDSSDNTKEVEVTGKPTVPRLHLGKQWATPPVTPKQSPRQRSDSVSKHEKFKRESGAARRETVAPKQEKKPKSPSLQATDSETNADERKGGRPDRPWH
eukprot:Rhum_TRINITY_DN13876_c1_g1::Rhum_TRINITY_DN13876_c1_g1_i1::g.65456::m.65456